MTAINDVFSLKLSTTSTYTPVPMVNQFWYKMTSFGTVPVGDPVARELALVFNTGVVSRINDCTTTNTTYELTEVVDYGDPSDFDVCGVPCGYPSSGARLGAALPAQNVFTFRYLRPFPGKRNGYKRFSGISETDIDNNILTASVIVVLDLLAASLSSGLTSPLGVTFLPIVATGVKVLGTNPAFNVVSTVDFAGVGSQNSRKAAL